jgi:pimeloyl-ACP methyl ester carboxylesterase
VAAEGKALTRSNRKRTLTGLLIVGVLLGLAWVFAGTSTAESPTAADPQELTHTLSIPLEDGKLNIGELMGGLLDLTGANGQTLREKINLRIDVTGKLGRFKLDRIAQVTDGIVQFEVDQDRLLVTVDRLRLRRGNRSMHAQLRRLVEWWFPEYAAKALARHGIALVDATSKRSPLAEAELGEHVVLLVHGLDDAGKIWRSLTPRLLEAGYTVCELDYPNDQPIIDSAAVLADALAKLKELGVRHVSLVAHSMGGLVCREVLTNPTWYGSSAEAHATLPRVNRLIMIGTPNQGSSLAKMRFAVELRDQIARAVSGDGLLFGGLFDGAGEAKDDLLPDSDFLKALNARPNPQALPITIIAGALSPVNRSRIKRIKQQLPEEMAGVYEQLADELAQLSAGVGDGVVSIDATRLDGVTDHVVVKGNHLTAIRSLFSNSRIPPAVPIVLERLSRDAPKAKSDKP